MRENHANIWQQIARTRPEKIALVSGDRRYTYEEFEQLAEKAAGTLSSHGVQSGDAVGFYLHNTAEFLIGFYACLKLGATPAPMNYRYRGAEVAELVQTSRPKAMLYRAASREEAAEAQRLLDESAPALWVEIDDDSAPQGRGPEGAISFDELLQGPRHQDSGPASPDGELYIFTGGTTGRPKAVVWEIGGLMDIQGSSTYPPIGLDIPETLEQAVDIATSESTPQVNTLPLAPFIHATALFMSTNTLNVGGTVVVNPNASLDARAAADLAIREHVTQLIVAGDAVALPAVEAFEEHPDRDRLAVQSVLSSGMRFSDETKARLHRVASLSIFDILASSEGGPYAMAITRSEADLPARFRLTEGGVVLDEGNNQVQDTPGSTGILAFRGALPKGYLNEPERSLETYPVIDGVRHVRPGDYVEAGEDRHIEFLGRGSAVINTGGEKVYPAEVEQALLEHPGVHDAVVFGLPDKRMGEQVCAVVGVEDVSSISADDLRAWVRERLAGYKKPRIVAVRQSLDRTPAGKVNMKAVKETAREAASQET